MRSTTDPSAGAAFFAGALATGGFGGAVVAALVAAGSPSTRP